MAADSRIKWNGRAVIKPPIGCYIVQTHHVFLSVKAGADKHQ